MPDPTAAERATPRSDRLRTLSDYAVLETASDAGLDSLVRLAARLCDTPISLVTLVDDVRQLFRAQIGYDGPATAPLDAGFCPIVVAKGEPLVIPDTLADAAHAGNAAAREGGVRFYAGVPLIGDGDAVLGTLCVLDTAPRPAGLTDMQMDALLTLSAQVISQFELRRSVAIQQASSREREALARVQAAIPAAGGDLDSILATLVSGVMESVPAAQGGVLELIDGDALEYRAVSGTLAAHAGLRVPMQGSLAGHCATTNEAILVDDARGNDRAASELVERLGLRAAVLAPVARGGQVLGVLKLQSNVVAAFGPRDLEAVRLFAGAATAGLTEAVAANAQRAVLAGARRQRAIFDSAVDFAIIATDRDGLVTDWNVGAERVLGWTRDEMRGQTVERIFTPEDRAGGRAKTEMRLALGDGRASDERWHLRRDGGRFWASGEMMPLRDEQSTHLGFLKILRDRTAEHEASKALREMGLDLQRAQAAGGVGVFSVDVADNVLRATPEFHRIYGLPADGYTPPEQIQTLILEEDAHLIAVAAKRASGDIDPNVEYRIRRADTGEIRWLSRRSEIERDQNGKPARFFGVVRDITDERNAIDTLARSEALARENIQRVQLALGAGAITGTWFWDITTDRFTVDEGFAEALGIDPALGRDGLSLDQVVATVHPDDKPGLLAAIEAAVSRGGAYAHQYRVRRLDGTYYWIEANGRVEHAPDGTPLHFPGVLIDLESRRAVEAERDRAAAALRTLNETLEQRIADRTAELMHAEAALRQSQKMEAVGQLTGGLAHDFNNLLTGVTGSLELLQTRIAQGRIGEVDRYVTAAQGAAKRAAGLTHRLLAFSRRQTLDPKPTNVNRLVAGMEELVQRTVGPEIAVVVTSSENLWSTLIDPGQLENALLNLCINARDAMPDGGQIIIETANQHLDEHFARDRDMQAGPYVSLCVSDTGTGMTADVVAKAFDPFFTTKPIGMGTGLGLSMIYGFAKQSGGQVRIHSEEGKGTTVCLYLPRHAAEADVGQLTAEPIGGNHAEQGETVLVVDDEPTVRMLVVEVLEDLGYTAIEAPDGAAGLQIVQSSERIDLLITDVGLPGGMNGRQMADAARVARPELKVLFITGYAENAVVGHGHLAPGMHVLTKPFAIDALANRIRELISG